jgi:hypothetical protein
MSYYRTVIGGIRLNFLLRDHSVVTAEQLLASYADIDKGEVYREANKLLYPLLKPLIGDSMLHLIAKYQSTMDGRSVFNARSSGKQSTCSVQSHRRCKVYWQMQVYQLCYVLEDLSCCVQTPPEGWTADVRSKEDKGILRWYRLPKVTLHSMPIYTPLTSRLRRY